MLTGLRAGAHVRGRVAHTRLAGGCHSRGSMVRVTYQRRCPLSSSSPSSSPQRPGKEPSRTPLLMTGRQHDIGGMLVRRILPQIQQRTLGPFIFFDHMGPVSINQRKPMAVGAHPHIGLATFTYMLQGVITHRDSTGVVMDVRPGAVNLMVSGKGVVHSERSPQLAAEESMLVEGLQFWLALPQQHEHDAPSFTHLSVDTLPVLKRGQSSVRVLAGSYGNATSPFHQHFPWPALLLDFELHHPNSAPPDSTATRMHLPSIQEAPELGLYCVEGAVQCGQQEVNAGQLLVLRREIDNVTDARYDEEEEKKDDEPLRIELRSESARVFAVGGKRVDGGQRHMWWNFVASNPARIEEAKQQYNDAAVAVAKGEREHLDPLNPFRDLPPDEQEYMPLPPPRARDKR